MAEKLTVCKMCGAQMTAAAKNCPVCGKKLKRKRPLLSGSLILICAVYIICAIACGSKTPYQYQQTNARDISGTVENVVPQNTAPMTGFQTVLSSDDKFWCAVTAAQNLVEDELKSPATAKFPVSDAEYTVYRTGSQYKVTGYVDAQNDFGVFIRNNWTAFFTMGDTSGMRYSISDYCVLFDA